MYSVIITLFYIRVIVAITEPNIYGPMINAEKSANQWTVAKRFCSRKKYDAIYYDGKFNKAIEYEQVSRRESGSWDIGDRENRMVIYKFGQDFVTEQYRWQLEKSDNFFQSTWKNCR